MTSFVEGDTVRLSETGRRIKRQSPPDRTGRVTFVRPSRRQVGVLWTGRLTVELLAQTLVEKVSP